MGQSCSSSKIKNIQPINENNLHTINVRDHSQGVNISNNVQSAKLKKALTHALTNILIEIVEDMDIPATAQKSSTKPIKVSIIAPSDAPKDMCNSMKPTEYMNNIVENMVENVEKKLEGVIEEAISDIEGTVNNIEGVVNNVIDNEDDIIDNEDKSPCNNTDTASNNSNNAQILDFEEMQIPMVSNVETIELENRNVNTQQISKDMETNQLSGRVHKHVNPNEDLTTVNTQKIVTIDDYDQLSTISGMSQYSQSQLSEATSQTSRISSKEKLLARRRDTQEKIKKMKAQKLATIRDEYYQQMIKDRRNRREMARSLLKTELEKEKRDRRERSRSNSVRSRNSRQ